MSTKPPAKTSSTLSRIRSSSDDLISQIIELDTLANCARKVLEELPYFSRLSGQYGNLTAREEAEDIEARRNYGRLQLLVFATAEASNRLMDISEAAGDRADEHDDDDLADDDEDDDEDDDGSSGPAGTGQPGNPGSPGALTRGKGGTPPSQSIPVQPTPIPPLAPPLA